MKLSGAIGLVGALLASFVFGQETAQVSFHCLSIKCDPVRTNINGASYYMELGVLESTTVPASGELRPAFEDSVGGFKFFRGFYRLNSSLLPKIVSDDMQINLPPLVDINGNGINDFYEVSMEVNADAKPSQFEVPNSTSVLYATWMRAANSSHGILQAHMIAQVLKLDATFMIPFQIFEYDGLVSYAPGNPSVSTLVNLTLAGNPDKALYGALNLNTLDTDLFSVIPGTWTNGHGGAVSFQGYLSDTNQMPLFERTGTLYEGLMAFDEGSMQRSSIPVVDIFGNVQPVVWDMLIQDTNDYDANGIPDLTDINFPPPQPRPGPPLLGLNVTEGQLLFTLAGKAGYFYTIDQNLGFKTLRWYPGMSIILTNDTQTFTMALPLSKASYWRARMP